jgi:hypothetical protein
MVRLKPQHLTFEVTGSVSANENRRESAAVNIARSTVRLCCATTASSSPCREREIAAIATVETFFKTLKSEMV